MRVALYARVSKKDPADEGFSIDTQIERLRDYCEFEEWTLSGIYKDEGYSGSDTARPGYQRMMASISQWDAILVLKMDRIHRNSNNFNKMMDCLNDNGKHFISSMEKFDVSNAMGRFAMDIIQRIAQLECEKEDERAQFARLVKPPDEQS